MLHNCAMTYELLTGLVLFALVSSLTPGPNNLMLMASGANYGFRRTLPHMLGVSIGFTVMVVLVGMGLLQLFNTWPLSYQLLKFFSAAYLLYLAWCIAGAQAPTEQGTGSRPFSFLQAAMFQWVNPKAWAMALTAVSVYAAAHNLLAIAAVAVVFGAINLPLVSLWVLLGQRVSRWLTSPRRLRIFNVTMAALLVASLIPVFTALDEPGGSAAAVAEENAKP